MRRGARDIIVPSAGGGGITAINVSACTTSNNLTNLVFSNGSGVTFGLNGSTITASVAAVGGAQTGISGIIVSDATYSSGTVSFSNQANITIGSSVNGATQYIRLSGNPAQTNQSAIKGLGVSNTGNTLGNTGMVTGVDWVVAASGGITASQSTGVGGPNTIWMSVATVVPQSNQNIVFYASSNTTAQSSQSTINASSLIIRGAGIASVGYSAGEVVISVPAGGGVGDGGNTIVAGTRTALTSGAVVFSDSNGISFGLNAVGGSIVTASYTVPTQSVQTLGGYALGNTTGESSSSTWDARTISIKGSGIVSVGWSNSSLIISAIEQSDSFGVSTMGNTAGSTGLINGEPLRYVLVGSNGITLSQSSNGSSATLTILDPPPASLWFNGAGQVQAIGTSQGNSLVSVFPLFIPTPLVGSKLKVGGNIVVASAANNSSAYFDLTLSAVFYTLNGRSLSSIFSASASMTATWSSNSTVSIGGVQQFTASFATTTLNPNMYFVAVHVSTNNTATGGAATTALGNSLNFLGPGLAGGTAGVPMRAFNVGTNDSQAAPMGIGIISTGATRASIDLSAITATGSRGAAAVLYMEIANVSNW